MDPAAADRLRSWWDEQELPGAGAPLTHAPVGGGAQNEIHLVQRGDLRLVLRRPPAGAAAGRHEGLLREWRILRALRDTDVPHPRAVASCTDPLVIGAPFILMEHVEGWSPMSVGMRWPDPFNSSAAARRGLADELVDGIAELSLVDWRAGGLEGLGRPDGFHDRQVDRWSAFLQRVQRRELPGFDAAARWLRARRPLDYRPGIMHGDYQFANVMFQHGAPARLAAIIDWEMGTVGDPKLDLGWMLQDWPDPEYPDPAASYVDMRDMPTRDELLHRYATRTGRQVDDIDYYLILARWKLAVVLEQGYVRALDGIGDIEKQLDFGPHVLELFRRAADLAERSDYGTHR